MDISLEDLKNILVAPGHVSEADFSLAAEEAKKQGENVQNTLLDKGFIKDEQLGQVIAEHLGLPFMQLGQERIEDKAFHEVPEAVARSKRVVAVRRDEQGLHIGMVHPDDLETRHALEKRTGETVVVHAVTDRDLESTLARYRASLQDAFSVILEQIKDPELSREERDIKMVNIVDMLLLYSYQNKASDIHIEPYTDKIVVRFRIDGLMHDVLEVPKEFADLILTRIKILSKMRTDEHRAAQDGRFTFDASHVSAQRLVAGETQESEKEDDEESEDEEATATGSERADVRVSIVPVTQGENVVMRILTAQSRQFSLTDLGLSDRDLEKVMRAIKNPHGMILVTGPTGSGKTTTLYAVMKILNKREIHISTIEDPVEYDIEGISQIQVNMRTNLSFAKGLRALVRQDPDIIMVGEIRDEETADIAVNSAMTGHLVLSTLHANDAATTLPRLFDMGVEPFLIASTVNVVIAQRLVRKICTKCLVSHEVTDSEKQLITSDPHLKAIFAKFGYKKSLEGLRLYHGTGCNVCGKTGYAGRLGIFEVLEVDEEIRNLITQRAAHDTIMEAARKNKMNTMLEDGVEKVLGGITTLSEVIRVTRE
jgi:type II secretory ATPase GspE/PulE/Tfp pilus assembly ATPase PilB-like protein